MLSMFTWTITDAVQLGIISVFILACLFVVAMHFIGRGIDGIRKMFGRQK